MTKLKNMCFIIQIIHSKLLPFTQNICKTKGEFQNETKCISINFCSISYSIVSSMVYILMSMNMVGREVSISNIHIVGTFNGVITSYSKFYCKVKVDITGSIITFFTRDMIPMVGHGDDCHLRGSVI